jgi:isopentenyldiphosphate isomerase
MIVGYIIKRDPRRHSGGGVGLIEARHSAVNGVSKKGALATLGEDHHAFMVFAARELNQLLLTHRAVRLFLLSAGL